MKLRVFLSAAIAAGLAGCATGYVPPRPAGKPGPEYDSRQPYPPDRGPGIFGDLTWHFGGKGESAKPATPPATTSASEQEEFKKWRESAGSQERQEFEEWRAWQEWKRKNPK
jgi:hypothetical protein